MSIPAPELWRLAVDFGTSNTAAAMSAGTGSVVPLQLEPNSFAMPSAVVVLDGEVHTGQAAARLAAVVPWGFEPTPKCHLGEDEILLDGRMLSPVLLVAAILSRIYRAALRQHNGAPPVEVVLTFPEAWRGHRLERLRDAAVHAGIPADRIRMVSEPVAAAWYYAGSERGLQSGARHLAVLDFGGGTLDVALLRLEERNGAAAFVVVDQDGIDTLGGHDFDTRLLQWTLDQLRSDGRSEMADALARGGPESLYDTIVLRDQVRQAKHTLSEHASAPVAARVEGQEWVGLATRDELVGLIGDDLDRVITLLGQVLSRSGVAPNDLHKLYLTGGSTHIPELHARLERLLPGRIATLDDPKQVTCLGALRVPTTYAQGSAPAPFPGPAPAPAPTSASHQSPSVPPQEPVVSRSRSSGRAGWVIVAAALGVCAVVGIAAALASPGDDGGDTTTTPSLDADALIAVLPAGFTDCDLLETTTSSVMVGCSIDDGGPTSSAVVQQYEDVDDLNTTFDAWAAPANLAADAACPAGPDGVYTVSDEAVGRYTCGTGVDGPQLVWTQTDIGVLVVAYGDSAASPGTLYEWFLALPVLSKP